MPVPFGTADDSLFEFGRLSQGETALIHAGASGVGIAAIQLAHRAGATVLATASSAERPRCGEAAACDKLAATERVWSRTRVHLAVSRDSA